MNGGVCSSKIWRAQQQIMIKADKKMPHKKVTLAKVTAKNDPPESTRIFALIPIRLALLAMRKSRQYASVPLKYYFVLLTQASQKLSTILMV